MDFLTGIVPSAIAVILSLVLFIYLSYRGVDLIPIALLCAVVVSLTAKNGFFPTLFGPFMTETSAFLSSVFLPFVTGGILGSVMLASGCSLSIGKTLVKWLGPTRTPYIIMFLCIPLQMAGIATTPFILVPIAMALLKASNLPKRVGLAAAMGTIYTTQVSLPGVTAPANLMPTYYFGTSLTSGGIMGTICWVFSMIMVVLYVKFLIWDARRIGDGWDGGEVDERFGEDQSVPNFWVSIIPIVLVIAIAVGMEDILGDSYRSASLGQVVASLFVIIVCRKHFISKLSDVLNKGIKPNIEFTIGVCLVVGYAAVVQETTVYETVMNAVLNLNVHPYVLTFVACGLICGICANGYGGLGIFLGAMGGQLMSMPDVNPGALHRLSAMTSTTFDSLPHCSGIQINLGVWKMSVKEGYKYCFLTTVINPLLYTILGLIIAFIMY